MTPESRRSMLPQPADWAAVSVQAAAALDALAVSPEGIARQTPYDHLLAAQRRRTNLIHRWLAQTMELEPVAEPRMVLSLDVDGVLEDDAEGFSAAGLPGIAALRLLQLDRVAVVLNTARDVEEVRDRIDTFRLLGGVAAFGAAIWDGVFQAETSLRNERGAEHLQRLRIALRADPDVVLDGAHHHSVRASRIFDGVARPIAGSAARQLLDRHGLNELAFWVAPRHTDFVDRRVDKGLGMTRLLADLGLSDSPLAAMGDSACDIPMLKLAAISFVPAGAAPAFSSPRGHRLVRCRNLGDLALWEAACELVPSAALQRRVLAAVDKVTFPDWFPTNLRRRPPASRRLVPRLAAAFASITGDD